MTLPTPYYQDDAVTLYHGDCREILPDLPAVDLVLTDPPYGIGDSATRKNDYIGFVDSGSNLDALVLGAVLQLIDSAPLVVLTPGVANVWRYPRPSWILCWSTPAGAGSGPWGFCCWQPVLVYGKDPWLSEGRGRRPDLIQHTESAEKNGHPCPKPIGLWNKLIHRVWPSMRGVALDPFAGSGTTLRAAKDRGGKAIGIEIEERYCEIAAKRMAQEVLF